jgi:hypothetical protein
MNIHLARLLLTITSASLLAACSVAKLEARLEANPQCKDVVNPKTGLLMPCPGSDKAFYREVGLAPAKPTTTTNSQTASTPVTMGASPSIQGSISVATSSAVSPAKSTPTPTDCKPQIHKKTGGTLPCPAPD